jgi:hypothetical protein
MESWDLVNLPGILPCCQFRSQTPMITAQYRISGQSTKQQWLCTLWFLTHTPCWPWYQQKQPASHAWTQKMHSFASSWHLWANPSLLSNGRNPQSGGQQQLTWTHLLQGFKNSPAIFETALTSDLWTYPAYPAEKLAAHSYLLLAVANHQDYLKGTKLPLCLYGKLDTRYLRRRLRSVKTSQGQQNLDTHTQKQVLRSILTPTLRKQIREFLKMAGFCQIWIPNFSLLAKPLYIYIPEVGGREPLIWKSKQQKAFCAIKETLVSAPALGLPDVKSLSSSMYMRDMTWQLESWPNS